MLTLDSQGAFENDAIDAVLMSTREALEWYFKQLDHSVGLSFKVGWLCVRPLLFVSSETIAEVDLMTIVLRT